MIKPGLVEFNRWETDGKAMGERYHTIKRIRRAYEKGQKRLYLIYSYSFMYASITRNYFQGNFPLYYNAQHN